MAGSGDRGGGIGAGNLERLGGKLIFYGKFKENGSKRCRFKLIHVHHIMVL